MPNKIPITVYLDQTDLDGLTEIHSKHGTPLSTAVRMAVKQFLKATT